MKPDAQNTALRSLQTAGDDQPLACAPSPEAAATGIHVTDHRGRCFTVALPTGGVVRTFAQSIYTSGCVDAPALCSGVGICGKCRIRFSTAAPSPHADDLQFFSEKALDSGWRLGCKHIAQACARVELPSIAPAKRISKRLDASGPYLLAVDLGTTSLHWRLLARGAADADEVSVVAHGAELNPQMGAGSEVMSRMAFALHAGGGDTLRSLVVNRLRTIVNEICPTVQQLCIAGNSVMVYLLLGLPLEGLAQAPYRLAYRGGTIEHIAGLPPAYIPPLPAPFVGADITSGITAIMQLSPSYPFMLADLGTNGEFVLALTPESSLVTSVALGPALEGIGLTFGTNAQAGAITRFSLTPAGIQAHLLPDASTQTMPDSASQVGAPPVGISGTGYLSLVHLLKKVGLIGEDGRFVTVPFSPLAKRLAGEFATVHGEQRLRLPHGFYVTAGDLEELLKVKASFSLAFSRLLHEGNVTPAALRAVYLAGSLGEHAPVDDLEGLGFLPQGLGGRVRCCGNASLSGAECFLLDPSLRGVSERWSAQSVTVDLTLDADFTQNFMRHMRLSHI